MPEAGTCVPLADLETAVRSLRRVEARLAGATRRVGGLDVSESGFLVLELSGFADHWHHGLSTLHAGVSSLATALATVHDAYERHERELSEQFGAGS